MSQGSTFRWFSACADARAYEDALYPILAPAEQVLAERSEVEGFCSACCEATRFIVDSGVHFADQPNLREGLLCTKCGMSNRSRLIMHGVMDCIGARSDARILLAERTSLLYGAVSRRYPNVHGSEFIAPGLPSGQEREVGGVSIRHEDMRAFSYPDATFDLVVHGDVLEHVCDFRLALRECRRVVKPGGTLLFTCPFLLAVDDIRIRAVELADGRIEFRAPAEYHGDPMRAGGALTFHHFGWELVAEIVAAGFASAELGVLWDLHLGFASCHHPVREYGNMLPLVFRGRA